KLGELLRSSFLRPLLCAPANTFRLDDLWRRQGLVLVWLDRTALGDEGARLLGGLLVNLLLRTAMRLPGSNRVILAIDELPLLEGLVGDSLAEIVAVARSLGLHLQVA